MSNAKQMKRLAHTPGDMLMNMLETLPGALFFLDDTDTIIYMNAQAQAITGVTQEDGLGKVFWRGVPHLVSTSLYQAVRKTKQTRTLTEVQYRSPVTQIWLRVHISPTDGGLMLQFHEERAPTQPSEVTPQREYLCVNALNDLHAGIILLTPEGVVLEINKIPLENAHIRREEVIGKRLTETSWWSRSPASQEQLRAAITRANRGETVHFEALIHPREGSDLYLEATVTPHMDAARHVEYLVIAGVDVTARKQAEADIHALIDAIPQLVWTGRPDGYIDYCNQRWRSYTGMTTKEAQGYGWMQCTHPDDRQRVLEIWQRAVQAGKPYEAEQRLRDSQTGEYRWFLMQAMPYKDARGKILTYVGTCTDIHDKKQAVDELHTLIDAIPQFVWIMRPDGACEACNQQWCDYTNKTSEQLQGDGWLQFLHPEERQRVLDTWQTSVQTHTPYEIEHRIQNGRTGEYRWFLARGMPVRDSRGALLRWVGTCTDIDDRKQAEQKLKESRENLRVLAETVPQLIWVARPDGLHEYTNQRWRDYIGFAPEHMHNDWWLQTQFIHPDDLEDTQALWQHALETGGMYEHEERIKNGHTGEYHWFLTRGVPIRDDTGQIIKWFGTSTDIDEQKRAEQQLKASEQNFRMLAETVPQLVWTMWPNGRLDYTNQRYHDVTRADLNLEGDDIWRQYVHPEDIERTLALRHQLLRTGEIYENEYRIKDGRTGEYRWYLTRALPVRDEAGQVIKWFGTGTDIDDQKRIEEALRQSQEQANVLMNSSIIGINIIEGEQIVDANDAFLRMTGYTREDLRAGNVNWMQMTPPEYRELTRQVHQQLAIQKYITPYEKEYVCKDGSRLPVLVGGVTLQHHSHQAIVFVLDNSARKELEQRKDAFISMASHELKTPLTALKMQAQLARRRLERQSPQEAAIALSRVEGPIQQLERLISELLDVSKIQAGRLEYQQEAVDLDALLHEVVDTMQQISSTHTIVVRGATLCSLEGDKDRLSQVLINLISNAIKYSPGAETVEIDLCSSSETATIRVRDHGLGIPQEQRDKIFERFYRVSSPNQKAIPGLGMGLYIVAEIVRHHGGSIAVESTVGKGSTFTVKFQKKSK